MPNRSLMKTSLTLGVALVLAAAASTAEWVPTTKPNVEFPVVRGQADRVCKGDQVMTITGDSILTNGIGIMAEGNCQLVLTDVEVRSTQSYALVVRGQAKVTVLNSRIEGVVGAVAMTGKTTIDAKNTQFWGGFVRSGPNNRFVEDGSNAFWPRSEADIVIKG